MESIEPIHKGVNQRFFPISEGMVMPWEVSLVGDLEELQDLAQAFARGPFVITSQTDQPNSFILTSHRFEDSEGQSQVLELANRFIEFLRGANVLAQRIRQPLGIQNVAFRTAAGGVDAYVRVGVVAAETSLSPITVAITESNGEVKVYSPADNVKNMIMLAYDDSEVEKVLRLLSKGFDDWTNLYRIYEVINEDVNRRSSGTIVDNLWAEKSEISRFTHTANSPDAIGTDSRHGYQRNQPPSNPMTFQDATALISRIANTWIHSKNQQQSASSPA